MPGRDGQAGARAASFPQTPKEEYGTSGPGSQGCSLFLYEGGWRMQPPRAEQWHLALSSLSVLALPNKAPAPSVSPRLSLLPCVRPPGLLSRL